MHLHLLLLLPGTMAMMLEALVLLRGKTTEQVVEGKGRELQRNLVQRQAHNRRQLVHLAGLGLQHSQTPLTGALCGRLPYCCWGLSRRCFPRGIGTRMRLLRWLRHKTWMHASNRLRQARQPVVRRSGRRRSSSRRHLEKMRSLLRRRSVHSMSTRIEMPACPSVFFIVLMKQSHTCDFLAHSQHTAQHSSAAPA
jgi:hypothetical protein